MRRHAFLEALQRVVTDLEETQIGDMFDAMFEKVRKGETDSVSRAFSFRTFLEFSMRAARYGSAEKNILQVMELEELPDPDWWQNLEKTEPSTSFGVARRIRFAVEYLPRLAKMLEREYVDMSVAESVALAANGMDTLSIILVEDHGQRSTPDRLILALQGVSDIYQAIATMEGEGHSDLSVVAIDSGSDKSFDFLGLAKVMVIFKETLLAIWDRRVFHRHLHVSMCIKTIAESLPVIEKIHDMRGSGALSPEQAELLKRQMISGATKLLEVGAVSPEMEAEPGSSPRALMRPEPKLLAAPIDDERRARPFVDLGSESAAQDSDLLSDDEIEEIEHLLARAKKSRKE